MRDQQHVVVLFFFNDCSLFTALPACQRLTVCACKHYVLSVTTDTHARTHKTRACMGKQQSRRRGESCTVWWNHRLAQLSKQMQCHKHTHTHTEKYTLCVPTQTNHKARKIYNNQILQHIRARREFARYATLPLTMAPTYANNLRDSKKATETTHKFLSWYFFTD